MNKAIEANNEPLEKLDKTSLIELVQALRQQLAEQGLLIQQLRDQLAKNSQNSSKPPSSDGLKKPKTVSLRQVGKRAAGGEPGHQGNTLRMVEQANHVIAHRVESCPHCQSDLSLVEAIGQAKRQVFDLPPVQLEVTEHQAAIKQCPECGAVVKGAFPTHVSQPTQYGPRLKAQASYFNLYHFIPLARTEELLSDLYGGSPTEAAFLAANQQLLTATEATHQTIQQALIAADVVNFDESGLRVEGQLHWLHVASTATLTHYHVHPKRGAVGMAAGEILPEFQGQAVHDHWASYLNFDNCEHNFCNGHHLRELQFINQQYQQPWAADLAHLLCTIKQEVEATPAPATSLPQQRLTYFHAQYDKLMADGLALNPPPDDSPHPQRGRPKQSPPKNLLDRLKTHKSGVLAFMHDFRIPFDNNQAERDIRMIKVKQKIAGSFRTSHGADIFCALRSYISTARKQGLNVLDSLYNALLGQPFSLSHSSA